MIAGKVTEILNTGLVKFAKDLETTPDKVQIQVSKSVEEGRIIYKKCKEWHPVDRVKFRQIMNVRADLLGFEFMALPFLEAPLQQIADATSLPIETIFGFIHYKNNELHLAFYTGTQFHSQITLMQHFENMALT